MAILTDTFLSDLNELSYTNDDSNDFMAIQSTDDTDNTDNCSTSVSKLRNSQRFVDIMRRVEAALSLRNESETIVPDSETEYQLVVDGTELSVEIEEEIDVIHNFIRDKYRLKFPELESIVRHPVDYATVVRKIGNETDLTLVDFDGVLPSAVIMVVSLAGSTTSGKPLGEDVLQEVVDGCDAVIELSTARERILEFVEGKMVCIAPNVTAIVGSAVAAKLIVSAGGLEELSKKQGSNVRLLGAKKENLAGFSTQFRVGYIQQTDVYKSTPPDLKKTACRLVCDKVVLAARVDFAGDVTGSIGRTYLEEIRSKIEKMQELPPAKIQQPMPVPDSKPKKKRGGRRARKMKERYALTHMRKLCNRMRFGVAEPSSLGDGYGVGYGMAGQAATRKC